MEIKAINYLEQILKIKEEICNNFQDLSSDLSKLDKAQQDILHEIERKKFSASKGYEYARKLKDIREERRNIKDEQFLILSLKELLGNTIKTEKIINNQQKAKIHITEQ